MVVLISIRVLLSCSVSDHKVVRFNLLQPPGSLTCWVLETLYSADGSIVCTQENFLTIKIGMESFQGNNNSK